MNPKLRVLVLLGGDSPERDISLGSGDNVARALEVAGYDVVKYDPLDDINSIGNQLENVDVVFPILHGINGEDGVVQKFLETYNVAYLGSDSVASANAFNKVITHKILENHGVLMPKYRVVSKTDFSSCILSKKTFVLKPINGGSSLDTLIARAVGSKTTKSALKLLEKYSEMIIEELIEGQELTVAVLDNRSLDVIAIVPPVNEEFSYENKYNDRTQELCPAPTNLVSRKVQTEARNLALRIHGILGLRHLSRSDFIYSTDGRLYTLECNTMPGMRPQSLFPKAALAAGYDMPSFAEKLVKLTLED